MSNGLAIAAVTSTLRFLLDSALQHPHPGPVGSAHVTTLRPDRLTDAAVVPGPCINVFLYQVTSNSAWNMDDLPTRDGNGSLSHRPVAALDLHYLVTCHGEDESLDAQRLLGRAVTALAVTPVMTRDVVAAAMAAYGAEPETTFLREADLADQVESVKMSPAVLSLEELSKLWSVMLQTPYQLSLTYTATVVLIQADVTPRAVLPVRTRNLTVDAAGPPRLAALVPDPPGAVIVVGTPLVLAGSDLTGPGTLIRIGPAEMPPGAGANPQELRVVVDDTVPAGLHAVQVLHRSRPGPGGEPARTVAASNALPLLVRPTVTVQAVTTTEVTLSVHPPLFPGQRGIVTLQSLPGQPEPVRTVSVDLAPVPRGAAPQATVVLAHAGIPDGAWLLRIQVDGADSPAELVGDTYGAPALTLP
jgi:hypothetical protein